MTETTGKIGSKGELYTPVKIRSELGFNPGTQVKFTTLPDGRLLITKIPSVKELLSKPPIARITVEEAESISEEIQKEMESK